MAGRVTPAVTALRKAGVAFTLHEYDVPETEETSYGEAVAVALGVNPEGVFKTLVAAVDDSEVVGIVPVTGQLSLKKLARERGGKRGAMADPATAERLTGYVVGGISPFGQRRCLPFLIDRSVERYGSIFVSGGGRGIQIEVAPGDVIRLTGGTVADLVQ